MKTTVTFLFLIFIYVGGLVAQERDITKLDSFFNEMNAHNKSMGTFAMAEDGKIVYQKTLGFSLLGIDTIRAVGYTI